MRQRQIAALATYNPQLEFPVYQRGQFKKQLGKDAKMYP